jgi:hypothetical protein
VKDIGLRGLAHYPAVEAINPTVALIQALIALAFRSRTKLWRPKSPGSPT